MISFSSFPQIPKGPQGKESLMIVPMLFGAFVLIVIGQLSPLLLIAVLAVIGPIVIWLVSRGKKS